MRIYFVGIIWACLIIMSGCCSIMNGVSTEISFNSQPNGAKIMVDGTQVGVTPAKITLNNYDSKRFKLVYNNCEYTEKFDKEKSSGCLLMNAIFTLGFGFLIDSALCSYDSIRYDSYYHEFSNCEVKVGL